MVYSIGLENRRTATFRGFESYPIRQFDHYASHRSAPSGRNAPVVQLVEHLPEEQGVSGSIPFWGTTYA